MSKNFVFEADLAAKKIHMSREFNAPIEKVWKAFTDPELLDRWVAPKPYTAKTKTWDFTVGGVSLYAMTGPDGQQHWVYAQFTAIENGRIISTLGAFCDADGNPMLDAPKSYKDTKFSSIEGNRTKVDTVITFEDESTLKWFAEGGFKEGSIMCMDQLDELLTAE